MFNPGTLRPAVARCAAAALLMFTLPLLRAADPGDPSVLKIGDSVQRSGVPPLLAQDRTLPAQSISAIDISAEGRHIAVTTMAFRHDRNFWMLSAEGKPLWGRTVLPWAPYQVSLTRQGDACAVAVAHSRITSPHPFSVFVKDEKSDETVLTDSQGERGWLRYGNGDWRTGWLVSSLGDQFVGAGNAVVTIPTDSGAWKLADDGAKKLPAAFPTQRPYRLAASGDGRVLAYGFLVPDVRQLGEGVLAENFRVQVPPGLLCVHAAADGKELARIKPPDDKVEIPKLPDPAADFPELAEKFALRADAILPFWVASSVSVNADGSRVAFLAYRGWLWIRSRPAIGRWDPPYHAIPFLPRQRGWLHVADGTGKQLVRTQLPKEGLFEVRLDSKGDRAWCYPAAWFARGMAGCAWMPTDDPARSVLGYRVEDQKWAATWEFPDAISDMAIHPTGDKLLVSCWDGNLYLLNTAGEVQAKLPVDGPARLQWRKDGRVAVAGTQGGAVVCLDSLGKQQWRAVLSATELPPLKQPVQRVFDEVPVYQVGRTGTEHAYVGDTWLVKSGQGGILIDAGGTSAIPLTLQRIKSAEVDVKEVRHLLHTHSHGDHCGAGYLWRAMGLKIVAPASADISLAWLMPMLSDYGVWAPRPVDIPLPLKRAGDECEVTLGKVKVKAIFVPGHSYDSVIYAMELDGKRVVFTGDIGFDNQDILHRCWGDVRKARVVTEVVRTKVLAFKPDFVFRGHGAKREGIAFLEDLVKRSEEAIRLAEKEKK